MTVALVALGGAAGTVLRYLAGVYGKAHFGETFPVATLFVNVVGCALLGFLAASIGERAWAGVPLRLVFGTGVLGGFTTYSAFNLEALQLAEQGEYGRAGLYVLATVLGCLVAGYGGLMAGRSLTS